MRARERRIWKHAFVLLSLVIDVNAQHIRLWKLEYRFPFPMYFPLVGVVCAVHNAKRKLAEKRRRKEKKKEEGKGEMLASYMNEVRMTE